MTLINLLPWKNAFGPGVNGKTGAGIPSRYRDSTSTCEAPLDAVARAAIALLHRWMKRTPHFRCGIARE